MVELMRTVHRRQPLALRLRNTRRVISARSYETSHGLADLLTARETAPCSESFFFFKGFSFPFGRSAAQRSVSAPFNRRVYRAYLHTSPENNVLDDEVIDALHYRIYV